MKILVVCASDAFQRRLVALSLAGLGCRVEEVADRHALELLCQTGEVLLVIWFGAGELMGSITGVPPRCGRPPRPALYLFSWHHTAAVAVALLEQGVDQCMTLPLSISRLRRKVSDLLKRSSR